MTLATGQWAARNGGRSPTGCLSPTLRLEPPDDPRPEVARVLRRSLGHCRDDCRHGDRHAARCQMTDARKEAIEQVAKDTEMLPGSVDHWAHHPQYGDEKLRSAVDGWERAIVRGRLLRETEAALSELFLWTRRGNRS